MTAYAHTEDSHDTVACTRYPCAGKVKKIKTSYVKGRTESMLLNMSATLPRPTPVCFGKTYDARSRSRQGVGLRPAARP